MASNVPSFAFEEGTIDYTPPTAERTIEVDDSQLLADDGGNTLSPLSARFPPFNSLNSPARSSHLSAYSPSSFGSDKDPTSAPDSATQPFNFTPQQYVVGRPPGAAASLAAAKQTELGRRRGHKYARSSVSHQIILSPTPRLPLQLPTSLPIPTLKEFRASMTSEQRTRWLFCAAQLAVAGYVQWGAHDSMATTALSHLLFFDALSSILCTAVLVGRNFEVWTRSSLRNPFGLERTELVAGLAMSIVLLFMGLDLISHGLTHSLENVGGHEAHHAHVHHEHAHDSELNIPALAAILSTLISATSSASDSRVGRSIQHSSTLPTWVPTILRNPPHVLILTCATLLLALPLLQPALHNPLDSALAFTLALAMIFFGARLCYALGRVLLMSYPSADSNEIREFVAEIWEDDAVVEVSDAKVWMVHYGLCMANFRVKVRERGDVERVRRRIDELVRTRLARDGGVEEKGRRVRWEVSSMVSVVGSDRSD